MAANQFLIALKQIEPFPNEKFIDRLYNKARRCSNIAIFQDNLPAQPAYGEDPDSFLIDGVNVASHLELLAEHAAVKGLARYDPSADKHGLRNCANSVAADIVADALFSQTSTMLYSEHINWSLTKGGSADLKALRANPEFVNDLDRKLSDSHFVSGLIRQDLINQDHHYTTALLFVYDYVHLGPGFTPHLDSDFASAPSGRLLAQWTPSLLATPIPTQMASIALTITKAASLVHALTNTDGLIAPAAVKTRFQALSSMKLVPDSAASALNKLSDLDAGTWQSTSDQNKTLWANLDSKWANAVVQVASKSTSTTNKVGSDGDAFGEGFLMGLTLGMEDHQKWERATITGQEVANWINQGRGNYPSLFTQNAPNVVDVDDYTTDGPVHTNCFTAGTQVAVEGGSVAIEKITEWTRVLTNADPETYGVASDEDVVVPLGVPFLCGINDEKPFFTPGHVFYTTAGLKAVDPDSARRENPWLDVGRLGPGHILYRLSKDGKGYEHVEVKSIKVERSKESHVFGLHLREGQRSYHANGYLVAVNYPEVTVKSIAKLLATFSKHEQTVMLSHINELKPLFARFGTATISDVLTKELQGTKRRKVAANAPRRRRRIITSHLRKARRTYVLHLTESENVSNYQLPFLSIHEGTVSINGKAQHRALVDSNDRTIRWTRPVPDHGYEHGFVDVLNHGLAGNGIIILSDDPDLEKIPAEDSARKLIRFQVAKPNVDVGQPSTTLNHAEMNATMKVLKQRPQTAASGTSLPAVLSSPIKLEIPGVQLSASTPVTAAPVDPDFIDGEDYWDLTLDQDTWPAGQTRTKPLKPVTLGQVAFATYHSGGKNGLPVPILTMPLLDQLCADINKKQLAGQPQLSSLYSSVVEVTSDGTQMGTIYLDSAALLYQLADKPAGHDDLTSMLGVSFKNSIGSSVVLPILFRTLAVQLSYNFDSARGAALEYDFKNRGGDGVRHYVQDTDSLSATTSLATINSRFAISRSLAAARPQPIGSSTPKAAAPAPVTLQLSTQVTLTTAQLEGLTGYNSVNVHNTSQTLLQNMMLYHMNADDRTTFLQTTAPTIPIELGANLQSDLKQWIQNQYGPAYISFMLSQTKSANISWRNGFSDAEKDKIWYWWSGQGDNCLSTSSQYNKLNALTSVYAMRQLYGDTLNPFISDGGSKWAGLMLADLTKSEHAMSGYLRAPIGGGESILNKYCNIFNALDPQGSYADDFFDRVVSYAISKNIQSPYLPVDQAAADKQKEWLNDSMKQLIIMVLNKDPGLLGTVQQDLLSDLNTLESEENIDKTKAAEVQAEEIVTKASELTTNVVTYMGYIQEGFQALARCNGFKAATAVVNKALKKLPNAGGFPAMKGLLLIVVTAGYLFSAINAFKNWGELTGNQRAIAIIATIGMVVDIVDRSIALYKDIKQWRADKLQKTDLTPDEASKAEKMDQDLVDEIRSPDGAKNLGEVSQKVDGRSLRQTYLDGVSNEQQPTKSAEVIDNGVEEMGAGEPIAAEVNEKTPPEGLPPSARAPWETFSTSEKLLKCANIGIGFAFTIAMSLDLKENWDNYTDAGKALNVLQIVVQGLTVLVDAAILAGDAAISLGLLASTCEMMVVLPVLGAILAVIGIVVMLVLSFLDVEKPKEPPPTPVETFLANTAHPLVANIFPTPPAVSLTYEAPSTVQAGSPSGQVAITATNNTSADVALTRTTMTLEVGNDDAALFSGPATSWAVAGNYDPSKPGTLTVSGTIGVAPTTLVAVNLTQQGRGQGLSEYDLAVLGPAGAGTSGPLILKKGQSVTVAWLGAINKAGSTTLQIVETLQSGDKCRFLSNIARA